MRLFTLPAWTLIGPLVLLLVAALAPSAKAQTLDDLPSSRIPPNARQLTLPQPKSAPQAEIQPGAVQQDTTRSPGPLLDAPQPAPGELPPVFGARMFTGAFSQKPFSGFNPDYRIQIGDMVRVQLWGPVVFGEALTVDAQGNIFLPNIGPVRVLGVRNEKLTELVRGQVRGVYRDQVGVYANLEGAQPVSVLVSGFVRRPGMYGGLSSDSPLYYLDLSGGIDTLRGSFIDIKILRNGKVRKRVNLYNFLLEGKLPSLQFADGDTIHVGPLTQRIIVDGDVNNAARFEFTEPDIPAGQVIRWASPRPGATHFTVRRNNSGETTAEYQPLIAIDALMLKAGDHVTVVTEDSLQQMVVKISGEHFGAKQHVVTPGTRIGEVLDRIITSERTNIGAIQLFRESVRERQTALLHQSLDRLEREVLATRSSTDEEAALRLKEAELIRSFIEQARLVEPQGLVVLEGPDAARDLYLEDGDVLFLPARSSLVTIAGEVRFPTAATWQSGNKVKDYVQKAGGFSDAADTTKVLLRHANGEIETVSLGGFKSPKPQPGDEIMVLPEPNVKNLQFGKAIAEILFRVAVAANVLLTL